MHIWDALRTQCLVVLSLSMSFQLHPETVGFRISIVYLAEVNALSIYPHGQ